MLSLSCWLLCNLLWRSRIRLNCILSYLQPAGSSDGPDVWSFATTGREELYLLQKWKYFCWETLAADINLTTISEETTQSSPHRDSSFSCRDFINFFQPSRDEQNICRTTNNINYSQSGKLSDPQNITDNLGPETIPQMASSALSSRLTLTFTH